MSVNLDNIFLTNFYHIDDPNIKNIKARIIVHCLFFV